MNIEIMNQTSLEKKENTQAREVWIIDDEEVTANSVKHYLKLKTKDDYIFNYFKTGQSAFEEITKRKQEEKILPNILILDGNLNLDTIDFNKGDKIVRKIRELPEIEQPIIIAYSSASEENEKMEESGANLFFPKIEFKKISEFLSVLAQNNSNNID